LLVRCCCVAGALLVRSAACGLGSGSEAFQPWCWLVLVSMMARSTEATPVEADAQPAAFCFIYTKN
jgi:hypothetical protein